MDIRTYGRFRAKIKHGLILKPTVVGNALWIRLKAEARCWKWGDGEESRVRLQEVILAPQVR